MTAKKPRFIEADARVLLDILNPPGFNFGGIHLVAIHPKTKVIFGKHFAYDTEEALAFIEQHNAQGMGVYWSVNAVRPHRHKKPAKEDISHARFVHVDIDPPKNGGKFDKPLIVEALSNLPTPPSFVIDSGGGLGAFWRLDEPCENLASIEAINRQVQDFYGADHCWNIDRVMRVPGTINYPDKVKMLRGRGETQACWAMTDEGTAYAPEELAAAFPAAQPRPADRASVALPTNVEPLSAADIGASEELRIAIEEPPGLDRSGDGLAAARLMAFAGCTDAQIMGVLLNPANAVSAHFLDQRDAKRAAARVIAVVRADGPPSIEPERAPMSAEDHARLVENMRKRARASMVLPSPPEPTPAIASEAPPTKRDPAWLTELGNGGLAEFVRHVADTSPSPQPWVALGAALATFGAIAGRRYASPTDLRTNIYSIGLCDSGGGKDYPLKRARRLMIEAGLQHHMGGASIASGQAMITDLTKGLNVLYPIDEIGFLISNAADRRRAPKHVTDIIDKLTEFYSMANDTWMGTSYADQSDKGKPRQSIEQPCLCLFGITTPSVFWGSLSSGNVLDGSLARMFIFESEQNYPEINFIQSRANMPQSLIDLAKAINEGAEGHTSFPQGQSASFSPRPYSVPYADIAASKLFDEMRREQRRQLIAAEGTNITGIIARLAENAAKLALVKAITDDPGRPIITVRDLEWGMRTASRSVEVLTRAISEKVADTEYEANLKYVHEKIRDAGPAGLTSGELSRKTQKVKKNERRDIIADLVEQGRIRFEERPRPDGKPGPGGGIYYNME
jgi:hypothetical protein